MKKTYITGKALGVYEMIKERFMKNFIYSIMNKDEVWANVHLTLIDKEMKNDSLFNFISKFRNHIWLKASRKFHQSSHSAFSVSLNQQPQQQISQQENERTNQNQNQYQPQNSFRGRGGYRGRGRDSGASFQKTSQTSECLCGEIHYYSECKYLNLITRSSG